jgi:hypothetical protein
MFAIYVLSPALANGHAGFLLSGRVKQGFQGIDRDEASATYLDAGELPAIHPLVERDAANPIGN